MPQVLKTEYHGKNEAYTAVKGMLKVLGDPYTRFLTPQVRCETPLGRSTVQYTVHFGHPTGIISVETYGAWLRGVFVRTELWFLVMRLCLQWTGSTRRCPFAGS